MNFERLRQRSRAAKKPDPAPPKPAPPPPAPKAPHPYGPFEPYMEQLNSMPNLKSVEFCNSNMWKLNFDDHPNQPFGTFEYTHLPFAGFGGGARPTDNQNYRQRQPRMSLQGPPPQHLGLPAPAAMDRYHGYGSPAVYHGGPPPPQSYHYGPPPPTMQHYYGPPPQSYQQYGYGPPPPQSYQQYGYGPPPQSYRHGHGHGHGPPPQYYHMNGGDDPDFYMM